MSPPHLDNAYTSFRQRDPSEIVRRRPKNNGSAGFGIRLVAYLIDVIPLTILMVIAIKFGYDYLETDGSDAAQFLKGNKGLVRSSTMFLYLGYCAVFETSPMEATPGKWLMGLRVTDLEGNRLTAAQSSTRNSAKLLGFITLGYGFICMLWSENHETLHDKMSSTVVVLRPKDKKDKESPKT